MSKVILAKNAGFCFGVQRAVEEALKIQRQYNKKIYTLGPLIHNNDVVTYLEHNKIFSVDLKEIDTLDKGEVIVIRSHGVSESVVKTLEEHQLIVINATCPFVTNIQKKVRKFSEDGYKIVILGDENHPEVIGINGWCDDKAIITKDGNFDEKVMSQKVCAVSQTTEKEETWKKTVENLTVGSKELLAFNTICSATEVRQKSAKELSQVVDVMIVVGGKNSSNTTKLYEIAKGNCKNTIHIENKKELSEDFIKNNKNKSIGITAGASTPDWVIREVVEIMEDNQVKMDDQLALMNSMDKSFKVGDEVEGEILSKTRDGLMISLVGYGRDGIIPNREITSSLDNQGVIDSLNIGDLIKAKIIKLRNDDGYAVLSRLEYEKEGTI
ncbi:MAG: 4-hydroxy-3-methylbut-2-enyl diphosphate reductase, partial [Clostridium sp.]